jgi:hypothetical protein
METKKKWPKPRKIKTADGTIIYTWDGKMHNLDGPAYIPQGDNKKAEYYVHGIKYTKERFEEIKKDQTGLPWYKTAMGKQDGNRY